MSDLEERFCGALVTALAECLLQRPETTLAELCTLASDDRLRSLTIGQLGLVPAKRRLQPIARRIREKRAARRAAVAATSDRSGEALDAAIVTALQESANGLAEPPWLSSEQLGQKISLGGGR